MRDGLKIVAARGVTAVHDKDGWLGAPRFWQRLAEEGALTLRVWQSLPHDHVDRLEELGFRSRDRRRAAPDRLPEGLHGRHARLADRPAARRLRRPDHEPRGACGDRPGRRRVQVGRSACTRSAISANREALDAFEETRDDWEPLGLRQRIEHAQLLAPEDIPRFGELGVAASVQFSHAPSDRDLADRNWAGKTDGAYAYRSLLDSGAVVANGSDAPIEELDPLAGIRAGVLRTLDEREAWHPEQAVTVEQALEATIVAPAWLARRRAPPRQAPARLPRRPRRPRPRPAGDRPEELPEVEVVATMLGGRWMHNPRPGTELRFVDEAAELRARFLVDLVDAVHVSRHARRPSPSPRRRSRPRCSRRTRSPRRRSAALVVISSPFARVERPTIAAWRATCRAPARPRRRARCARRGSARSASGCSPPAGRSR